MSCNKCKKNKCCCSSSNGASSIPIINVTGGVVGHYKIYASDADRVKMSIFNLAGSLVDLVTLVGTTKIYLPEIRIYP